MELTDILTEHRIPHHTEGKETRNGWINLRCPYCQKDPYLGYNLHGRYFHCWSCGHQPLIYTLTLLTGLSIPSCKALAGDLPHGELPAYHKHTGRLKLPEGAGPLSEFHREYIRSRGLLPSRIVHEYDVQGLGQNAGDLRWRLLLPITLRGEVVSWTSRAIGKKPPRYWSAKDEESAIPITNLLYGIDACRNSVIVVEGPVDVWKIGMGSVALMGQRVSPAQLEQISRFPLKVICFDHEPDAEHRASRLCNDLSAFPGRTVVVHLESANDPASASKEEIESLRKEFLQ